MHFYFRLWHNSKLIPSPNGASAHADERCRSFPVQQVRFHFVAHLSLRLFDYHLADCLHALKDFDFRIMSSTIPVPFSVR